MNLFKVTLAFSVVLLILSTGYSSEVNENMIKAAGRGDIGAVKDLITKGADVNAKLEGSDWTALHLAAGEGHTGMVKLLIESGADVNVKDAVKNDPLRRATVTGHIETVQVLLDHGANVNAKGRYGFTALMGAGWLYFW
ncbi:MAG: ankyrin repeat domain-containing protein [Deltaproteobacteria bacterium]|nr:ankyrin repeat domain-containing protein [Deltaproteobacteria bacterium]